MLHGHRVVAKVGQRQVVQQDAAVGMGIGTHPAVPGGRQRRKLRTKRSAFVEQLLRPVAAHPAIEKLEVLRLVADIGDRDLVRPECSLRREAVDLLRARPALGRAKDDHRPPWPGQVASARAARWIAVISSSTWSSTAAIRWWTTVGSLPFTT